MSDTPGLSTLCVHSGLSDDAYGSPHTPMYATTTFAFPSTEALLDVAEGRKTGGFYTRYGLNPSIQSVEAKLAAIEGAEAALVFSAGMAAAASVFLAHGRRGIVCLGDAYGGTLELLESQLPALGIPTRTLLGDELGALEAELEQGAGMVFLETPANPTLEILDLRAVADLVHRYDALLVVDNTFATPVNQNPLALGADIVMHSATKYLGGHSDLTGGALMASNTLLEPVRAWRKNLGQVAAPQICWLLERSLCTLVVRVERQNANASALAHALAKHPRVKRVLYPGLPDFPGHAMAQKQMRGFGGMLTLEIDGTREQARKVVDNLKLIANAPSLGGVESLATQPVTTTHHDLSPEARARRGITDTMIRVSVGLENADDLIADLDQALRSW